jgi:hypothetical protein
MKRLLTISTVIFLCLSSCSKDETDNPLNKNPEERLREVLREYKQQLVSSEHGWKAVVFPEGGAGYSFHLRFLENDRVIMYSDIDENTASVAKESTFRLKSLGKPALSFDSYTYIHILSDPDARKSGGDWGQGKYSDFEFTFESSTPESITLKGVYNGSKFVLTKATQNEAENFIKNVAKNVAALENINTFKTYFKKLSFDDIAYDVSISTGIRFLTFSYFEGASSKNFTTSYYFTENGLELIEPFEHNSLTIKNIESLDYNSEQNKISFQIYGKAGTIEGSSSPSKVDIEAARDFFNSTSDDYWLAVGGFTIEGVFDALKVREIPGFELLVIFPKFQRVSGQDLDLMGFYLGRPIEYGPAAAARLSSGKVIYSYYGFLGDMPEEHETVINQTIKLWTDPAGFYVVPKSYGVDLVSAKDGRSWISLF